jgi:hypothetical protein
MAYKAGSTRTRYSCSKQVRVIICTTPWRSDLPPSPYVTRRQRRRQLPPDFSLQAFFFFSGSLYLLALTGARMLGLVTPLGGVCFLVGWGLLAFAATRLKM